MSSIRINCSDSTYVDKIHPDNNYSKEAKLLTGVNHEEQANFNIYKSLLKFDTSKLNSHTIQSAFLYLFIEKIRLTPNHSDNITILKNINSFNSSTTNWLNCPKTLAINKYSLKITSRDVSKYIKINITKLVQSWVTTNENYGISIEPLSFNSDLLLQFASKNSLKPPYLSLTAICNSETPEYDYDYDYNPSMVYCFSTDEKVD